MKTHKLIQIIKDNMKGKSLTYHSYYKELLKKAPAKFFYIDKQDLKLSNGKGLIHNTGKEMLLAAGLKLKITNIYSKTDIGNSYYGGIF